MKPSGSWVSLLGAGMALLWLGACGKKEGADIVDPGAAPSAAPGDSSEETAKPLAYLESVRAGMDDLVLKMSFEGQDGVREEWEGRLTMVKDRFATVEHVGSEQKKLHLRRWANVHIAEIPASGEPRANRTEDSPLTGQQLVADRLATGGWKHRLQSETAGEADPEGVTALLEELDRVEAGAAAFYQGHSLAVGERWQVPASAMVRWFGDEVTGLTGDINVVVDRTEPCQGGECVVLKVDFATTGKMRDPDGQTLDIGLTGAGEIVRSPELGEDLKVDIRGQVTLDAAVAERNIQMTISGPLVIAEERELRK